MSLKINVIYRGIIYRVKGIKVLCSVVLAVIILLVAIVGMGVWMLVTVYDEDKSSQSLLANSSEPMLSGRSPDEVPDALSIDFRNFNSQIFTTLKYDVTTQSANKKGKLKEPSNYERKPAPDPNLSIFGVGLYNEQLHSGETEKGKSNDNRPDEASYSNVVSVVPLLANNDNETTDLQNENLNNKLKLSFRPPLEKTDADFTERFTPHQRIINPYEPNLKSITYPVKIVPQYNNKFKEPAVRFGRPIFIDDTEERTAIKDDIYHEYESIKVAQVGKDFSRRSGVPSSREELKYVGPPVVGYGPDPYKKISKERIEEYDSFWKTYASGDNPSSNINSKMDEAQLKVTMVPHLRGLRPPAVRYDLPLRPDAQAPSIDPALYRRNVPRINFQPSLLPQPRLRGRHPIGHPIQAQLNPDRRLYVGNQPSLPSHRLKTTPRPTIPVLGPLQDMYDYSKRLAASLLSFNTKSDDQIKETSNKLAQHGIKLIEDYSYIFENAGGSLGKLSALVPTSEKLKDLDPFQLSLVTWTFLDFWEFLIEKVGTLSPEDLELLQERLEKLRKRKDSIMTHALVNETMTKMTLDSLESPRSLSSDVESEADVVKHIIADDKDDLKDKYFEEIDTGPINMNLIHGNILTDLFPHVSVEAFKEPVTEKEKEFEETTLITFVKDLVEVTTERILDIETEILSDDVLVTSSPNNSYLTPENITVEVDTELKSNINSTIEVMQVEGRTWDPLGLFSSEGRMQFMQFAIKVVFNFGKVYLKKPYALDCVMLLFCKDLNHDTKQGGIDGMAAKVKSVGLKVLTQTDKQLREGDTLGEVWRSVTAWAPLQCEAMFPNCNGPKALEIVNEVAQGSNNL